MNTQKFFFVLMILAMVFWGISWPCSKILVSYAPAYIIAFWRFFFTLIGLFFLLLALKIPLSFERKNLKWLLIASVFNVLYSLFFFAGLNYGLAGKGGVLATTLTPVFTYLLVMLIIFYQTKNKPKVPKNEILGLVLGIMSGILLLDLGGFDELFGKFNTFFVLCAFDWALMSIVTQKIKMNALVMNFYITIISVFAFTPIMFMEQTYFLFEADLKFWINILALSFLSTVVGTSIYYLGIKKLGSAKANSFLLLIPAIALFCSFIILDEKPSLLTLFGTALAIFAIYLINVYGKEKLQK